MTISLDDLQTLRAETAACNEVLHFNNAGASPMPDPVYRAVIDHLSLERQIGGYEAAMVASGLIERFHGVIAGLLNVRAEEIAFVENATRAWDMAFYALPLQPGDEIITHQSEYASNYLAFLHLAAKRDLKIVLAPSDASGQLDIDALEGCITGRTRLIAITHVPTQGGLVNPAAEVGKIARRYGLTYLLDACQSIGQMEVDIAKIGCDILSGTGRKFLRGPRGTGFLYVAHHLLETMDPPFIDLQAARWTGDDRFEWASGAQRFETWEGFVAGRIGLAEAVIYAQRIGMGAIEARISELAAGLRERLAAIEGVRVHDRGVRKCGIVTFEKTDLPADELAARLRAQHINISVSKRSSAQLDLGGRGLDSLARASVHYFNTEDEIDRFCAAIALV